MIDLRKLYKKKVRHKTASKTNEPTAKRLGVKKDWPSRRGVGVGMDGRL